jgi:hypothetical protein
MANEYTRYRVPSDKRTAFISDYIQVGEYFRAAAARLGSAALAVTKWCVDLMAA